MASSAAKDANHDRPLSNSSALPTGSFLDSDPFPSHADGRPISAGTTTSSDWNDDFASARERQSEIPSSTGPVGEPGLPPSRPTSMNTSVDGSQRVRSAALSPPSSRRGLASFAARSGGNLRHSGGEAGFSSSDSRPTSAISRTHVPSLAAQGFFKPMSSQKLQAQRGISSGPRPSSQLATMQKPAATASRRSEDSAQRHRYSNASVNTLRDGLPPTRDEDAPPLPTSRGTAFTSEHTSQHTHVEPPGSVVSTGSTMPLHTLRTNDLKVDTHNQQRRSNLSLSQPEKSPRSLRASLGLGSRRTSKQDPSRRPSPQHEKLHSDPSTPNDDPHEKPLSTIPANPTHGAGKNYEYSAANLIFFFSGRLLNSKAKPLNVATFILTTLPAALFFGFSAPFLWRHVSPAIVIIFAYVFYITLSSFLHAAFSDPGILPRNLHPHPRNVEEERDPLTVGPPTTEWVMVKTFPSSQKTKVSHQDTGTGDGGSETTAMEVPTKYCKTCQIWRPPRAHHCRVCDACIETQDHHCVWLNNCVGRRNYRYFFAFVGFASLVTVLLMGFSLAHVSVYARRERMSFGEALSGRTQERVAFAMFVYGGETTREYLNSHKFLPKDRHRPFSQGGWWRNWVVVLTRPRPPTYMRFKRVWREGDTRMGFEVAKKVRQQELRGRYSVGGGDVEKGVEMERLPHHNGERLEGLTGNGGVGVNSTPR
ncbi:Eukaryotic peptide chain release factor GTP-binding subunit [Elasticomyces elasticus]|nr:Eukaryotic peptide chain release factor GTP-binding subunit [Elasticomyces elasticus]KAK4917731.1 Eukaryotic peptide chain release factor GTP-binding subunit [Elasticomyces elasticus]